MSQIQTSLNCQAESASYKSFNQTFSCHGEALFEFIVNNNADIIQIKKKHVAIANLKKLFAAAFKISSKIGFHEMSLRDLSRETGISMGSIYSCISKKDNLAIIVKDVVSGITSTNIKEGAKQQGAWRKLETTIRLHFYSSCVLQPWFSFLYMETRSLPAVHQASSKQIEVETIDNFSRLIQQGINDKSFSTSQGDFLAHTILVLLQDWYLKPWKHKYPGSAVEGYLEDVLQMMRNLLGMNEEFTQVSI